MASTSRGFVAHVFSTSATSESVSITKQIAEGNEEIKTESIFAGSGHLKPLIFLHNLFVSTITTTMCVFLLS